MDLIDTTALLSTGNSPFPEIDAAYFGVIAGIIAILFAFIIAKRILKQPAGNKKMQDIALAIQQGSTAYLKRQYRLIAVFVIVLAAAFFGIGQYTGQARWTGIAFSFIAGAFCSALAGFVGMNISVRANVRTAEAAKKGLNPALQTAFKGGIVMGLTIIGLGLLGISGLFLAFYDVQTKALFGLGKIIDPIIGFGFGASLIALFARVGGGIYTKAADVGADLVGKVEKKIPEDDPRNPAVIADNVGDNVGDCAGMGADLFESYAITLIAAMLLGAMTATQFGANTVAFPLWIGISTLAASIAGSFFVRAKADQSPMYALNKGIFATAIISTAMLFFITKSLFSDLRLFYAAFIGLLITLTIQIVTEHYTSKEQRHVRNIARASETGPGTNIITGLAVGFRSTAFPILTICAGIFFAYYFAGIYGIAIAAMAMISMTGIIVAVDTYGPITDNAGGIAEMSGMPPNVRKITDKLDAVGNTTKAVTKGFAIESAALAALSLFAAFAQEAGLTAKGINILNPLVTIGLFIGGMLPFLFSSFCMQAVGNAAFSVVEEVRRQFRQTKGLMQGRVKPDYAKCVDISTAAAQKELAVPAILAVLTPIIIGFVLGPEALGGLLAGAIVTGLLLAIHMTTGGAAWDNAKKYIEEGFHGGKGTQAHAAAVVGDTVGDPFKDTAGPALNPLIKVINMISLIFASLFVTYALRLM